MQNGDLIKHLHLHLIVFIWGFTAVLGALISLEAIPLVWFRMGIASLVVMMFVLITKKPLRFPKKTMFLLLGCLLYTSPSPRDAHESRMPSSA